MVALDPIIEKFLVAREKEQPKRARSLSGSDSPCFKRSRYDEIREESDEEEGKGQDSWMADGVKEKGKIAGTNRDSHHDKTTRGVTHLANINSSRMVIEKSRSMGKGRQPSHPALFNSGRAITPNKE